MDDKVKVIEFKDEDRDKLRAGLELMKRSLPIYCEHAVVLAQIRKASYDAHIEQSFTPQQALELCKSMTL